MKTRSLAAHETWPLRQLVLRPGQPLSSARYPADESPTTLHWGALDDAGALVAVATVMPEAKPGSALAAWRLRGMACAPSERRKGYGTAVLRAITADIEARQPAALLWFNARVVAIPFYEAHGFAVEGEEFEIEAIGPHFVMSKRLEGS